MRIKGKFDPKIISVEDRRTLMMRNMESGEMMRIVQFHSEVREKEMYNAGLQQNFKDTVDMEDIANAMEALVRNLLTSNTFTPNTFVGALNAFKPFIRNNVLFQEVEAFFERSDLDKWK